MTYFLRLYHVPRQIIYILHFWHILAIKKYTIPNKLQFVLHAFLVDMHPLEKKKMRPSIIP